VKSESNSPEVSGRLQQIGATWALYSAQPLGQEVHLVTKSGLGIGDLKEAWGECCGDTGGGEATTRDSATRVMAATRA
jgi:hypothetical protein